MVIAFVLLHLYFRPISVRVVEPASQEALQVFGLGAVEARVLSKGGFKVIGLLREL